MVSGSDLVKLMNGEVEVGVEGNTYTRRGRRGTMAHLFFSVMFVKGI